MFILNFRLTYKLNQKTIKELKGKIYFIIYISFRKCNGINISGDFGIKAENKYSMLYNMI